jgi:hypothetical protein
MRVPFVFLTGYGGESIEPRFADVARLEKPVGFEQLGEAVLELRARTADQTMPMNQRA